MPRVPSSSPLRLLGLILLVSAGPALGDWSTSRTTDLTQKFPAKYDGRGAPCGTVTLTESTSQAITALNSVSCNNGVGHTDNSYFRAFNLASFGQGDFNVCSVEVGVEEASSAGGSQPITINLYTVASGTFPGGALTPIGTSSTTVADQSLTIVDFPVAGFAAGTLDLVVEVFTPDGEAAGNLFFIGSNASAETAPSYLQAADCGVTTPMTTAAIGFPNMHIVMNVHGDPAGPGGVDPAGSSLVSESCTEPNGALDPGELVTMSLCVENNSGAATTNLVGTLQATGGVTVPSGPVTFGAVADGATACEDFTFLVDGALACGDTVTATLSLTDGATTYDDAVYTFPTGTVALGLAENFDGVTAPALPAGWTATNPITTDGILWVTTAASSDTAPNSAFVNDPSAVNDKVLDSPSIPVTTSSATVSFRHSFNLEDTFDGGVLEISIGGGPFTDIIAAGGSFVQGPYTDTISSSFSSPIAGRQAWSGSSGGYITTVANLPAAASGQNVVLRWRMGSDSSVSGTGWNVDTIEVASGTVCATDCAAGPSVIALEIPTLSKVGLALLAALMAGAAALLLRRRG